MSNEFILVVSWKPVNRNDGDRLTKRQCLRVMAKIKVKKIRHLINKNASFDTVFSARWRKDKPDKITVVQNHLISEYDIKKKKLDYAKKLPKFKALKLHKNWLIAKNSTTGTILLIRDMTDKFEFDSKIGTRSEFGTDDTIQGLQAHGNNIWFIDIDNGLQRISLAILKDKNSKDKLSYRHALMHIHSQVLLLTIDHAARIPVYVNHDFTVCRGWMPAYDIDAQAKRYTNNYTCLASHGLCVIAAYHMPAASACNMLEMYDSRGCLADVLYVTGQSGCHYIGMSIITRGRLIFCMAYDSWCMAKLMMVSRRRLHLVEIGISVEGLSTESRYVTGCVSMPPSIHRSFGLVFYGYNLLSHLRIEF